MNVRALSQGGTRWLRYLKLRVQLLPRGGVYRKFLGGYLLTGSALGGNRKGRILDLPTRMFVGDSAYSEQVAGESLILDPIVEIAPTRDLFDPAFQLTNDPAKAFKEGPGEPGVTENFPEFLFTITESPGTTLRYARGRVDAGYTGSGYGRGGSTFNIVEEDVDLYPLDPALGFFARFETRTALPKNIFRVVFSEEAVNSLTSGYRFHSLAIEEAQFPESVPIPTCDRRTFVADDTVVDGAALALPVVKNAGAYDASTNNANYGLAGLFFASLSITSAGKRPSAASLEDNFVLGFAAGNTDAFTVPYWGGTSTTTSGSVRTGSMPNRVVGDVAVTDAGDTFWGGVWETSREVDYGDDHVSVRTLVAIRTPYLGAPAFKPLFTTVVSNAITDSGFGYLSLDSDSGSSRFPFVGNVQCFAPAGVAPFFVGEVSWHLRDEIGLGNDVVRVADTNSAGVVLGSEAGVTFIPLPDWAIRIPDSLFFYKADIVQGRAQFALVDANFKHTKVGLAARRVTDLTKLVWVEVDLSTGVATERGVIATVPATELEVQPTVTCYQRMQSVEQNAASIETRPAGLLLTYGADGQGYTKLSKDSGATWQAIAKYAARTAPYYFGSGFFGAALDQTYYEVTDDG